MKKKLGYTDFSEDHISELYQELQAVAGFKKIGDKTKDAMLKEIIDSYRECERIGNKCKGINLCKHYPLLCHKFPLLEEVVSGRTTFSEQLKSLPGTFYMEKDRRLESAVYSYNYAIGKIVIFLDSTIEKLYREVTK
ncbi:MAG: hypothetical protein WC852_00740 [Candidatus Nanoarchaeia archaeon]